MGKQPVKLKAVVYALSPFQQKIMTGLWKDLPEKIHHKVSENWISTILLLAPVIGTYSYASLSISQSIDGWICVCSTLHGKGEAGAQVLSMEMV
ncbi:hypothetical protein HID58_039701 [Brassica napus]|uniref:Cytochrome b-c1 complex subunit 8 n=1 Tax=Brassica napus TaxID=3708 RepID=A0ABQ8BSY9_BRANA|nr:hypothetical protein HID58_039701 [Brassica napus]